MSESHIYPRSRDQNEYKFIVSWRYSWKTTKKDLSEMLNMIRMKLQNSVGKQITNLALIRRKFFIGKAGQFLQKSKKSFILWRIPSILRNFPICFLKYDFLITVIQFILHNFFLSVICIASVQVCIFPLNTPDIIIYVARYGRSISRNIASIDMLVLDVINLLHYVILVFYFDVFVKIKVYF